MVTENGCILRFVFADSAKEVYYRDMYGEGVPPELLFLRCFCIEFLKKWPIYGIIK